MSRTVNGLVIVLVWAAGCAQNTEAPVSQPIQQPQSLSAEQAQQGVSSRNYVYVFNAPGTTDIPHDGPVIQVAGDGGGVLEQPASTAAGNQVARASSGAPVQAGLTIAITTSGTGTGTQTPALSGSTATPGATITQSPTQKPEAAVSVPIAFGMPGSAPQATGAAGTSSSQQSLTSEQQNELRTLWAQALRGDAGALERIGALLFGPAATTQPAK